VLLYIVLVLLAVVGMITVVMICFLVVLYMVLLILYGVPANGVDVIDIGIVNAVVDVGVVGAVDIVSVMLLVAWLMMCDMLELLVSMCTPVLRMCPQYVVDTCVGCFITFFFVYDVAYVGIIVVMYYVGVVVDVCIACVL